MFYIVRLVHKCLYIPVKEAESYESGVNVKEEGECNELTHLDINESPELKLVGIDMSRIITYPGFNAPSK